MFFEIDPSPSPFGHFLPDTDPTPKDSDDDEADEGVRGEGEEGTEAEPSPSPRTETALALGSVTPDIASPFVPLAETPLLFLGVWEMGREGE